MRSGLIGGETLPEPLMEKTAFTRVCLYNIKVIMAIMCVSLAEWLCQAVMGRIPALKCLMSGARGCLWLHLVVPDIKCHRFPRSWLRWCLPGTEIL
jgi:hypothetical protein